MGYNTYFNLTIHVSGSIDVEEIQDRHLAIIADLRQTSEDAEYALTEEGLSNDMGAKWYNSDEELMEFSKKYPDVLFQMDGRGDDQEDMWMTYYKNGKKQHCPAIITYDPFDENKLSDSKE